MILFKEVKPLQKFLMQLKAKGKSIGFVPTMGALHNGHLSLLEASLASNDIAVCSIFVNPTQFNNKQDFEKYPVSISNDILTLEMAGCHILFLPSIDEVYPGGTMNPIHFDIGEMEFLLEGAFRPGHFQGVCQVVNRLLHVVEPTKIFLGQKDYQQTLVIRNLITARHQTVQVSIIPTVREASGLAMSSRNMRLDDEQKIKAASIYQVMQHIKANLAVVPFRQLEAQATEHLLEAGFSKVDYVLIADGHSLQPASAYHPNAQLIILVAAFIGEVRLIDNLVP